MNPDAQDLLDEAIAHNRAVARAVQSDLRTQAKRLKGESIETGIRAYDTSTGAIVRLGNLQSILATPSSQIQGNLWVLTEDGKRLGFKRMSPGYWESLKAKYGNDIFIRKDAKGGVVLYRYHGKLVAIYLLRQQVKSSQKLNLWDTAQSKFEQQKL
jgi:hypothetical protein